MSDASIEVNNKIYVLLKKIIDIILSFLVGFSIFAILKLIYTFILSLLVNKDILSLDNYRGIAAFCFFAGLYISVKLIQKINKLKKNIIIKIIILVLGFIAIFLFLALKTHL